MHECLLCERDMKKSKDIFGSGCTNNIFKFLNIEKPTRCKNKEQLLYKNIMKITNVSKINNNQKIWLTDRYLTYQYLNQLHYGDFENLKKQLRQDIENIDKVEEFDKLITARKIKLKEACDLYFAIHNANIEMKAKQDSNSSWSIDITLSDTFDFTKWKTPLEYYFDANNIPKSILSSTLYNLAFISQKLGVIKEYKVIAKLSIKLQENGEIENL